MLYFDVMCILSGWLYISITILMLMSISDIFLRASLFEASDKLFTVVVQSSDSSLAGNNRLNIQKIQLINIHVTLLIANVS